jgi:hypothetical protein
MSIIPIIRSHVDAPERRLVMLEPALAYDRIVRHVVLSQEVAGHVLGPWDNGVAARRCARVRADLDAIVRGDIVSVCLEPAEATNELFGLLYKPSNGIFDIRCRDPKPGIRILGGFAERDWFVALTFHPRSAPVAFTDRPPLGEYGSVEWANAIHDTQEEWESLFGVLQPLTGTTKDAFLSNVAPD